MLLLVFSFLIESRANLVQKEWFAPDSALKRCIFSQGPFGRASSLHPECSRGARKRLYTTAGLNLRKVLFIKTKLLKLATRTGDRAFSLVVSKIVALVLHLVLTGPRARPPSVCLRCILAVYSHLNWMIDAPLQIILIPSLKCLTCYLGACTPSYLMALCACFFPLSLLSCCSFCAGDSCRSTTSHGIRGTS